MTANYQSEQYAAGCTAARAAGSCSDIMLLKCPYAEGTQEECDWTTGQLDTCDEIDRQSAEQP